MPKGPERRGRKDGAAQATAAEGSRRQAVDWRVAPRDPFELWLARQLHDAFDHVCSEPIPDEILRLVEEDRAERERLRLMRLARPRK
jgi:hypothetical protein